MGCFDMEYLVQCKVEGQLAEYLQKHFSDDFLSDYVFLKLCALKKAIEGMEDC